MSNYDEDFKALKTDYFSSAWFNTEKDPDVLLGENQNLSRLRQLSDWATRNNFALDSTREAIITAVCGTNVVVKVSKVSRDRNKLVKPISCLINSDLAKLDKSRQVNISDFVRSIIGMTFTDGDGVLNCSIDKKGKTFFEFISGRRIRTPNKFRNDENVIDGIRYSDGIMVGAYVKKLNSKKTRDDDFSYLPFSKTVKLKGQVLEKTNAILVKNGKYKPLDQTRAFPATISSISLSRYFEDLLNTTLVGKKVSNAVVGFISSANPNQTADNLTQAGVRAGDIKYRGMLNPGTIGSLRPGEQIQMLTPRAASEGDDMFIRRVLRLMALPFQVPYEILHQDLKEINYSSWKGGQLQLQRSLEGWTTQSERVVKFIVASLLFEYSSKGQIAYLPNQYHIDVSFPRQLIIDPEKDARADKYELQNKLVSEQDLHDRRGTNYEATLEERREEAVDQVELEALLLLRKKELEEELGIIFPENQEKETRSHSPREGEGEVDEDTKKERRKDDGNW